MSLKYNIHFNLKNIFIEKCGIFGIVINFVLSRHDK